MAARPERPTRLLNRNFLLLWQGQAVSQLGNQASAVATAFWALQVTHSATLMGLLVSAASLPVVLLGPIGGAVADRVSRKRIVVVADALSGLAMLALALTMLSGRASRPTLVTLLFAVSILMGVLRAFFMPAIQAALPSLVPTERLAGANSLNQLTIQGSQLLGQGIGGVLYALLGAPILFLIDAVSFLVSACSASFIRLPDRKPEPAPARAVEASGTLARFRADLGAGLAYVKGRRGLLGFLIAASSFNFFVMPIAVLLPIYVQDKLGAGAAWYGYLLAATSVGSVLGFVCGGALRFTGTARGRFVLTMMVLAPMPFLAIGFVTSRPLALVLSGAVGAMVAGINVYVMTALQATTPEALRGRVLGLMGTLASGLMPIGSALGGVLGDLTHHNIPLVYVGCGLSSLALTVALAVRPAVFEFLSYREDGGVLPAASVTA
jgi:DHA3 family macrolide efflux protein-like MFS transporter